MYKLILLLGIYSGLVLFDKLPLWSVDGTKIVGCYFRSWAVFGEWQEKFETKDIDMSLCTHLIYSFIRVSVGGSVTHMNQEKELILFQKFNEFQKQYPNLKTLISMEGWNEGPYNHSERVTPADLIRERLVDNVVNFVKKHNFNGIDFHWEYPNELTGSTTKKEDFVLLLKALKEKCQMEGLILSVAVSAREKIARRFYDIKEIFKHVDFINLLTFDFHGASDANKEVGHNAPLYPSSRETGEERKLNVDNAVQYWILEGALPSKIVLGIAFCGKTYTLAGTEQVGRGALFTGPGSGKRSYHQVCQLAREPEWNRFFDNEQEVPYIHKNHEIIAYDDTESIKIKAEYANKMNLGGTVAWSIDQDDFSGKCGEQFPLLKTLNQVLRNRS